MKKLMNREWMMNGEHEEPFYRSQKMVVAVEDGEAMGCLNLGAEDGEAIGCLNLQDWRRRS